MQHDRDFLPDDIRERLGAQLGHDFVEAYALLCEAVYFGVGQRDDVEVEAAARRLHEARDYFFGDVGLFEFKVEVDKALRKIAAEVSRWTSSRERRRAPRSQGSGRRDLASAGGQGNHPREVGA